MGVAVLHPQDVLKHPFSHMKYPRNPSACPNKQKKPISNRTRRSPPRNQSSRSPSPSSSPPPRPSVVSPSEKKSLVVTKILKRGEEIPKKTVDLALEKSEIPKKIVDLVVENSDLGTTHRIGPDPVMIPNQIRLPNRKTKLPPFYAGPVTMSSPPPSDVPLPAFFTANKTDSLFQAAVATNHIIKLLRIDTA
ncbi:hypothetical protein AALP_AA7G182700 [Arabis alpina]|uniref:Uncharacterized protein n=1 Tax=Arabis alpina TaxID=50452 RepID=A0A087GIW4_ARAAL|nr:hypothetical protein AALP_AA7G182700 [Arabis alpina]